MILHYDDKGKKRILKKYADKTAGKITGPMNGFYVEVEFEEQEITPELLAKNPKYFIKKPDDKRELFIEGFIGKFYRKLLDKKLIPEQYRNSLISADFIPCDGGYALIQPCVSFDPLYRLIGTGYKDNSDRDPLYEMIWGPSLYPKLTQQGEYFGLSMVIMLALLVGNYSVHSGNIVVLKNSGKKTKEGKEAVQFAGLDNGAALRYLAHPENNDDILIPFEYKGLLNLKWFTKGYIANYRNIMGLMPSVAKHALALAESSHQLTDIFNEIFKEIPVDIFGDSISAKQHLKNLADYTCIPEFNETSFGPRGNYSGVLKQLVSLFDRRLTKLTELTDASQKKDLLAEEFDTYSSCSFADEKEKVEKQRRETNSATANELGDLKLDPFTEQMESWLKILKKAQTGSNLDEIDLLSFDTEFNRYVKVITQQADRYNLWGNLPPTNKNPLALFIEQEASQIDTSAIYGHAFVPQYREGTVLRSIFQLTAGGSARFYVYDQAYGRFLKNPSSQTNTLFYTLWNGLQELTLANNKLTLEKKMQNLGHDFSDKQSLGISEIIAHLETFITASKSLNLSLMEASKTESFTFEGSTAFYPISDAELETMSGDQLVTICLEEIRSFERDADFSIILRILSKEQSWEKVRKAYSQEGFKVRHDQPKEKWEFILNIRERYLQCRADLSAAFDADLPKKIQLLARVEQQTSIFPSLRKVLGNEMNSVYFQISQWPNREDKFNRIELDFISEVKDENKIELLSQLEKAYAELPSFDLKLKYKHRLEEYQLIGRYIKTQQDYAKGVIEDFTKLETAFAALHSPWQGAYETSFEKAKEGNYLRSVRHYNAFDTVFAKLNNFLACQEAFGKLSDHCRRAHLDTQKTIVQEHLDCIQLKETLPPELASALQTNLAEAKATLAKWHEQEENFLNHEKIFNDNRGGAAFSDLLQAYNHLTFPALKEKFKTNKKRAYQLKNYLSLINQFEEASFEEKFSAYSSLEKAFKTLAPTLSSEQTALFASCQNEIRYLETHYLCIAADSILHKLRFIEELKKTFSNLNGAQKLRNQGNYDEQIAIHDFYLELVSSSQKLSEKCYETILKKSPIFVDMILHRLAPSVQQKHHPLVSTFVRAVLSDQYLKEALRNSKTPLTPGIMTDLITLKKFYDNKIKLPNDQIHREMGDFYKETLSIRLSEKMSIKQQQKKIIEAAETNFTHRDYKARLMADVLMVVSVLFGGLGLAIMAGRYMTGHHPFFSGEPTKRQKNFNSYCIPADKIGQGEEAHLLRVGISAAA